MRNFYAFVVVFIISTNIYAQNWDEIKDTVSPIIELEDEFDQLYRQPLAGVGWEDGLHISNDGLTLYCTYVPIDLLSFSLNGDLPNDFSANYLRGASTFGMDLQTNPINASEWLHSDILYAERPSTNESFTEWQLSDMARTFYSEGAPTPTFNSNLVEYMLFTSNDNPNNDMDIWVIENTASNPSGFGKALPAPINTSFNEDNPHLIYGSGDSLILFFDSDNTNNAQGDLDLWYSISTDNATTWSQPVNVSSINTSSKEHQPFIFREKDAFYLYYSAYHTDGKLAIFRAKQLTPNDWNSWSTPQLVLSAGNAAGIGEPTLSDNGDLSFVTVYSDPESNSMYNRFDSDPWLLRRTTPIVSTYKSLTSDISIFPNPAQNTISIITPHQVESIHIYSITGELLLNTNSQNINTSTLPAGIYWAHVLSSKDDLFVERFVKE